MQSLTVTLLANGQLPQAPPFVIPSWDRFWQPLQQNPEEMLLFGVLLPFAIVVAGLVLVNLLVALLLYGKLGLLDALKLKDMLQIFRAFRNAVLPLLKSATTWSRSWAALHGGYGRLILVYYATVVIVFPLLEEIAFRGVLLMYVYKDFLIPHSFLVAMWWSALLFALGHAPFALIDRDPMRLLDGVILGVFNGVMVPYAVFAGGFPFWLVIVFFILLHMAYNFVVCLLNTPVLPFLRGPRLMFLNGLRLAAFLITICVYWIGLGRDWAANGAEAFWALR